MLNSYREQFAHLHTNRGPYPWPALTCYQAPHKPLLLLAVLELVASGDITPDLLVLTPQLVATFQDYWRAIPDLEEPTGDPVLPFRYLDHEAFWHRVPVPGKAQTLSVQMPMSLETQIRQGLGPS